MRNLMEYANECMVKLDDLGIEYGNVLEFKVNTRAAHRWGQCKVVPGGYSINISAVLLDDNDEQGLINTIFHELLHTYLKGCCNHIRNGGGLQIRLIKHTVMILKEHLLMIKGISEESKEEQKNKSKAETEK